MILLLTFITLLSLPLVHKVVFCGDKTVPDPGPDDLCGWTTGTIFGWQIEKVVGGWAELVTLLFTASSAFYFEGEAFPDQLFNYVENYEPKCRAVNRNWILSEGKTERRTWERFFFKFL